MPEILRRAAEQSRDIVDGALHVGRRHGFARLRMATPDAGSGRPFARLRKLHAGDAATAPNDAAAADRSVEYRKAKAIHDQDYS